LVYTHSTSTQKTPKKSYFPLYILVIIVFCIWFVWTSLNPVLPQPSEPPRLYSNQCQQDLTLTFLEAIQRTKESIHLVMFGLSDSSLLGALAKQIQKQIPTTIYYDSSASPNVRKILNGGDIHPIKLSGLMHQKILILDEETVFLGSANMTTPSLRMHDNLVVGLSNKKIAKFLKEKAPHSSGHLRTLVGGQDVSLWLLPDPRGHILADLKKKIRSASHSIRVALFTFTHPTLLNELIAAQKRGVDVTIVVDMHSGLGASAKTVAELQKAGIEILLSQGLQLMHHKFVYIDSQTLITGSANWTQAAFTKNSDCLIILHNLSDEQKSFMNRLWHRISSVAKKN
jgi:cardiolipin synthase